MGRARAPEIPSKTGLPSPNTRRWVARRKAAVVAAISRGMITIEEACRRYHMSEEEFVAWQRAFENRGILGLRAGCVRQHRDTRSSRPSVPEVSTPTPPHEGFDLSAKQGLSGS
jgi:hypothetical protein